MTEEDARKKWCPFARVMTQFPDNSMSPVAGNRLVDKDGPGAVRGSKCVASACMAWREQSPILGVSEGFCGLAGADRA